uniref:Uncharacterized protein n=1 Tax=Trichogramma kaykai TaxID=54128 RepID=A0ABD2XAH1_9HYME
MFESLSKAINNTLLSRVTKEKKAQSGSAITFIRQIGYWPLRAVRLCICTMEPIMEAFRYLSDALLRPTCVLQPFALAGEALQSAWMSSKPALNWRFNAFELTGLCTRVYGFVLSTVLKTIFAGFLSSPESR